MMTLTSLSSFFCDTDKEVLPEQLGTKAVDCTDVISGKALAEQLGYYPMPWESPYLIAKK
jgi:hypothetical protein